MKYMSDDSIFNEKLGHIGIQNNKTLSAFSYLFYTGANHLLNGIALVYTLT